MVRERMSCRRHCPRERLGYRYQGAMVVFGRKGGGNARRKPFQKVGNWLGKSV